MFSRLPKFSYLSKISYLNLSLFVCFIKCVKFKETKLLSALNLVAIEMVDIEDILHHHTTASIVIPDPGHGPILPVSTGTTDGLLDCLLLSMHM